jgi:hypothetical protein
MQRLTSHFEDILSKKVTSEDLQIISLECQRIAEDYAKHIRETQRPITDDTFMIFLINEIN